MDNWIDVNDRLPAFEKRVLVYCAIYGMFIVHYQFIGEFDGVKYGNWHDGRNLGILPPTHWQPLPSPPQPEKK